MKAFHEMRLPALGGHESLSMEAFRGRVVLVVNVASNCGLTPQYAGLEKLHQLYRDRGFAVLGVPSNDFAGQEPGNDDEIRSFCSVNYGVTFPMTSKLEVNGVHRDGLYAWLAGEGAAFPGDITWNFEKFLIGRDGKVLARFSPRTSPDDQALLEAIEAALV
ncbi:glutathione peroxidase [Stutzerimonas tarimensis]|uniref:Glutathione peroxidase n=1 Tax=Stutzerimonas tarimensis TaxID=1507735 RepID=A0ABV7T1N2_9GAMM